MFRSCPGRVVRLATTSGTTAAAGAGIVYWTSAEKRYLILGALVGAATGMVAVRFMTSEEIKQLIGHTEKSVGGIGDLKEGDHVSYSDSFFTRRRRHGIVAQVPGDQSNVVLAYLDGENGKGQVQHAEIDLRNYLRKGSLYVHAYSPVISYSKEVVAKRTMSLIADDPEKEAAIQRAWKFFRNDEHFAFWCQTGLRDERNLDTVHYRRSVIHHFDSLRIGDHLRMPGIISCEHGIVTALRALNSVTVMQFSGKPSNCPQPKTLCVEGLIRRGKLYRCDYDISVGFCGTDAANRAQEEAKVRVNRPYKNGEQFVVWCKTNAHYFSADDASKLASARINGCIPNLVHPDTKLKAGDHIAYTPSNINYLQHAIVISKHGSELEVIYLPSSEGHAQDLSIARRKVNISSCVSRENVYVYFYDMFEWTDATKVIERALKYESKFVCELPFKDAMHFAMWCKKGKLQQHEEAEQEDEV